MFTLTGRYNTAKVFTNNADFATTSQIISILNQPSIKGSQIRIMPDTHAGKGCVVGTTMTILDKVIPSLVGCDIGCGMLAIKLNNKKIDYKKLDNVIRTFVPNGFSIHNTPVASFDFSKIIAPINIDKAEKSLGTLGGGNHFIELDKDKDGFYWLIIHTGSRHLGIEIYAYHQDRAYQLLMEQYANGTLDKFVERDNAYLTGEPLQDYLNDMHYAQEYAKLNRKTIASTIIKHMQLEPAYEVETIHNYIDLDNKILRKGAVSASLDETLVIPMNMRDGILICKGKGNMDWNYSAPHGAGRILSRSAAKEQVSLEDYENSMTGIYSTSIDRSTIDESPFVYKPMDEIIENIADTVEVLDVIKPVYNFKASKLNLTREEPLTLD